jgi:Ca2+ transporting ATPase
LISEKSLHAYLNNCMVCIAILIVCVPEGMPVAVSIAAAFSMDRMQEDELLIKDVGALEAAG